MITPDGARLVRDHTVYSCVMGSRAFGLATEDSDTDRRRVFLAPTPLFWRFAKLEADVRLHGEPRWKHAMHLLRLLESCRDLLRTGELVIDVGDRREAPPAVKRGEVPWDEVERAMTRPAQESDEAATRSPLPPERDRERVEAFLVRTRRASAG
ncbi:DNA polymerase beta superfamily protein [Streptomyces sp. NPDC001741]|uniref:DNA polymerase beta superfamily protein n=1 Tax=Streptomyces sp. NPDC001741 TaxID=3364605 RepID=UPI0036C03741